MSSVFDIFAPKMRTQYSPFSGSPNQISTPNVSSPGQDPNISDPVISAYSRQPLWFSGSVEPNVRAVVESSLYYPLSLTVKNDTRISTGGVGGFDLFTFTPPPGKHWIMMSMLQTGVVPSATASHVLLLGNDITNAVALYGLRVYLPIGSIQPTSTSLIGGNAQFVVAGVPYYEFGIAPVYVGNGFQLIHEINGIPVGDPVTYSYMYYELPENQPFGPMIGNLT
jgi:hypothetical protein